MEKLITKLENGAAEQYFVFDQEWTEAALEELWREHRILFRADSVVAVRIRGTVLTLGMEDDGVLTFGPEAPCFHRAYAPALIQELQQAAEALDAEQTT